MEEWRHADLLTSAEVDVVVVDGAYKGAARADHATGSGIASQAALIGQRQERTTASGESARAVPAARPISPAYPDLVISSTAN
jgi:hypothetical protein